MVEISVSQYIFLGLVALTTLGAFVEASAYPLYRRLTFLRFATALVVPALWCAIIIFVPWEKIPFPPKSVLLFPVMILLGIFGPVSFVATIVLWVGVASTGSWKVDFEKNPEQNGEKENLGSAEISQETRDL